MKASVSEWNKLLCYRETIKISLSLFTPTYFAVAASHSELKPKWTFTVYNALQV